MKVVRLNEATQDEINKYKNAYNNAQDLDSKINILLDWSELSGISNSINKIADLGERFLDSWINSMKWEELGKGNDNELIKYFEECRGNSPAFDSIQNFVKMYNSYANGYFNNKGFNILIDLLGNKNLYNFDEKDFVNALRVFDYSAQKDIEDSELKAIFFEDPENPKGSKINSLETIYNFAGEGKSLDSSTENERINNMSNDRFNEFVDQLLSNKKLVDVLKKKLK